VQLRVEHAAEELGALLLSAAMRDRTFLQDQVWAAMDDEALFNSLIQTTVQHRGGVAGYRQLTDDWHDLDQKRALFWQRVSAAIYKEQAIVVLVDLVGGLFKDRLTRESLISSAVDHEPALNDNVESMLQRTDGTRALLHLLTRF